MRHLGEALDKVRKSEYARLTGKDRRFIKGQKYTLLSRRENLTLEGRQALKILLAANKRLNTAYLLKESFGQLWDYEREGWARRFFENWRASLKWQRLKPYEKFAEMIERHWDGIAAYCKPENKVSLGFVEGLNNKIRVIQRRAYGLRDEEYLRLKILTCMLPATLKCPKITHTTSAKTQFSIERNSEDASGRDARVRYLSCSSLKLPQAEPATQTAAEPDQNARGPRRATPPAAARPERQRGNCRQPVQCVSDALRVGSQHVSRKDDVAAVRVLLPRGRSAPGQLHRSRRACAPS